MLLLSRELYTLDTIFVRTFRVCIELTDLLSLHTAQCIWSSWNHGWLHLETTKAKNNCDIMVFASNEAYSPPLSPTQSSYPPPPQSSPVPSYQRRSAWDCARVGRDRVVEMLLQFPPHPLPVCDGGHVTVDYRPRLSLDLDLRQATLAPPADILSSWQYTRIHSQWRHLTDKRTVLGLSLSTLNYLLWLIPLASSSIKFKK